jgi:uncharacterized membrane protein
MTDKPVFADPVAGRIWAQYFRRMSRLLRALDEAQARELTLEVQGHLWESFRSENAGSEAERLLNAIDRLGEPESFVGPMRADRLLEKASKSFRLKDVGKGLYYHLVGGTRKIALGVVYVMGYLLAFGLALIAVLKIVFPGHVGLFLFGDGGFVFGYTWDLTGLRTEVLGYGIIPLCGLAAVGIYLGLTRLLKALKRRA